MTRGHTHVDDDAVNAWIHDDPDPATRAELTELLAAARSQGEQAAVAQAALNDAFSGTLDFGTAGLRGRLGGGPNRMNRVVVIRAAAGLSAYLKDRLGEGFSVVIGYDGGLLTMDGATGNVPATAKHAQHRMSLVLLRKS